MVFFCKLTSLLSKVGDYKYKNGPLGSTRKHDILDKEEVARLLDRPRSRLIELWKRGNLFSWYRKQNARSPGYNPSVRVRNAAQKVIFPGEKCAGCKKTSSKCLNRTDPLRALLLGGGKGFNF